MGESNKNVVFNWRPRFREALPSMDLQGNNFLALYLIKLFKRHNYVIFLRKN